MLMNAKWLALALAGLVLLSGCNREEPASAISPSIPGAETSSAETQASAASREAISELIAVYRAPVLEKLQTGAALTAACDAELANLKVWLDLLERFEGTPTVASYLEPFNAAMVSAYNMANTAGTLAAVSKDAGVGEAGDTCGQALAALGSEFSLSRPIFQRIQGIDTAAADPEARRYVEKLLLSFRLAGVEKNDEERARITQLNEQITQVGQEFDNNIRDSVLYLELDSVDQLEGLPQDYIDAHPPGEDGKIRISTQYPDLFPFMSYARSDELRHQLSVLRNNLAYPKNQAVLEKLLALRYELARVLGFEDYAAWVTADKMSGSPQRVQGFLDELAGYTTATQDVEYAMLLARLQQDQPDAQRVESWQYSYLLDKVKAEQFDVDAKQVREYFNYNGTRDGIFALVQDLFNVQIKPWKAYTWAEDVEAYALWDGDRLIGNFYLDMHPRPNKYQHAAQFPLRTGITGVQTPLAVLVCNFPSGNELMEHSDVETFLHEFGHLLHNMFAGGHHWADVSGINTEWDFVEAPSQMLEEWVWDYDTVSRFARNAAGEPIPEDLLKRMRTARDFGLGIDTRRQLAFAATSLDLYNRNPAGLDIKALSDDIARKYTPFEPLENGHFYASFGHLNNYSAIYYTYQWSLAIASDLFTRFKEEGLRNVETAGEYRDQVLGQGGAKPAAELVRDFLGREVSFKPYADRLSQAGQAATKPR